MCISAFRKYFICFLSTSVVVICLSLCSSNAKSIKPGFVYMEGRTFKLDEKDFYPLILNYGLELKFGNNMLWVIPSTSYGDKDIKYNKEAGLSRFKADMQMIKDLGFNAVRLVGIGEYQLKDTVLTKYADVGRDTVLNMKGADREKYFAALNDMFKILNEIGLKAIVLTKKQPDKNSVADEHLQKMLSRFKDEKAILAWDFFNEPLYFDKPERKKEEVYKIVKGWKKFARQNAPNQLLTIGLTGPREVFEWDPNILDVDFLSIHPYEFRKGEVENDIYWFGKYVKKAWIIGETGYSANGDSIKYDVQKEYGERFLKRALNCGASGFSWWQYKDVQWFEYQSNYLGIVTQNGTTQTSNKDLTINGTVKPVGRIFKDFDVSSKTGNCDCLNNYYNYDGLNQYAVKGKLVNKASGQPIVGGAVVAWNQFYGSSNLTYTKEDGSFILHGNYKLYHLIASSTLMDYVRSEIDWDKVPLATENGIPTYTIGTIKLSHLKLPKE